MPKLIDKLYWELEARVKDWTGGLEDAEKSAQKFTTYIAKHPVAAIGAFSAALVALGAKATQMAVDLEQSLAKTASIIGRTSQQMGDFRAKVLDLFQRVPVENLNDLTDGLYDLISAGIPAEKAMGTLEVAAKLAVGGFTSTSVAVDGLTSVLNAFADQGLTAQHAADAFFQSAKIGKTTVGELSQSIGSVAPIADALGVSLDDLLATITALSLKGVQTDEAFTGIRGVLTNILKPASQFAQQFPQLAAEFDRARLKSEGLTRFLVELAAATKGNDQATTLLFGDVRALNAVMALTADGGKGLKDILDQITHSAGETDKAFNTMAGSTRLLYQRAKNELTVAMEELGARILPTVTSEMEGLVGILEHFDGTLDAIAQGSAVATIDTLGRVIGKLPADQQAEAFKRLKDAVSAFIDISGRSNPSPEVLQGLTDEQLNAVALGLRTLRTDASLTNSQLAAVELNLQAIGREQLRRGFDLLGTAPTRTTSGGAVAGPARPRITLGQPRVVEVAHEMANAAPTLDALQATWEKLSGAIDLADAKAAAFGGIVGAAGQAALPTLDLLINRTEAQVASTKEGTKEHDAAVKLLEEELRLRAQIVDKAKETGQADSTGNDAHQQRIEQLREQGRQIQTAAEGAIQLANAFGLVDDSTAKVLTSITQIAANIGAAAHGDFSSILGVMGGIAGLVSAVGGDSPAARAYRQAIAENTAALTKLNATMGDLAHSDATGSQIAAAKAAAAQAAPLVNTLARTLPGGQTSGIYEIFARAGLSKQDVDALAQTLGITLDGSAKSWQQFLQAIQAADVSSVANKYSDALQHLKDSFEVNDITDPVAQLRQEIALLSSGDTGIPALASALGGLDVGTAQGRAAAIQRLQQLFNDLAAGKIGAGQLGGASIEQANSEILDLLNQLRGVDQAGGPAGTGGFSVDRSITEVTGSRLAGLLTTGNVYQRLTAQNTALIAQVLAGTSAPIPTIAPPALPSSATSGPGGVVIQGLTLTVQITLPAGTSPSDATTIGTHAGRAAIDEINRGLGDRLYQTQRARGQVPVT